MYFNLYRGSTIIYHSKALGQKHTTAMENVSDFRNVTDNTFTQYLNVQRLLKIETSCGISSVYNFILVKQKLPNLNYLL